MYVKTRISKQHDSEHKAKTFLSDLFRSTHLEASSSSHILGLKAFGVAAAGDAAAVGVDAVVTAGLL